MHTRLTITGGLQSSEKRIYEQLIKFRMLTMKPEKLSPVTSDVTAITKNADDTVLKKLKGATMDDHTKILRQEADFQRGRDNEDWAIKIDAAADEIEQLRKSLAMFLRAQDKCYEPNPHDVAEANRVMSVKGGDK